MIRYRAAWILPIASAPVPAGYIQVAGDRIMAVGSAGQGAGEPPLGDGERVVDLGRVAVLPGLVNAHTHLELSWLRGRVPPAGSMPEWVRALLTLRMNGPQAPLEPIRAALREARSFGTALVGDISNTLQPYEPLVDGPIGGVLFSELIRFDSDPVDLARRAREAIDTRPGSARLCMSLAAHAPYSVSPALFKAIRAEVRVGAPYAVHLAESDAELEFMRTGRGAWRQLLEDLGTWDDRWKPPGTGPVDYLDALGFLGPGLLAAHCVQLGDRALATLANRGVTVVACPRSNAWTGAGTAPIASFYRAGVRVAIGTDSLASCPDLNLFAELAAMRGIAPEVPASVILESATRQGAAALGFAHDSGTIEPGKRAELIAVTVPRNLADVEEYLVGGIGQDQVGWIDQRDSGFAD